MMLSTRRGILLALLAIGGCGGSVADESADTGKLVIAHRGASGYLPEHTIAAKAMAYAQGVDFIEQDLVMTRDDEVVVLHDHHLDTVSDVREKFPGRARDDGRYYVVDFTLDEIRQLSVYERFETTDGKKEAVFPDRFPLARATFHVHTFAEEIELIQGLNASSGGSVGVYPEIKSPHFHRDEGKDISAAVLSILKTYGYTQGDDNIFLQCFDAGELLRIHDELLPAMDMSLPLIQLLGTEPEYRSMLSESGIRGVAEYAVGIGPSIHLLVDPDSTTAELRLTGLAVLAHAAGLAIHPYTFRREAEQIPAYARNLEDLLSIFFNQVGVDGVFTDFPDVAVKLLESDR